MVNFQQRTPRVSVRIPSYNHEKYVAECLQSVLDQTFQDFEIIITDDGSSDRTVEIIRSFDDPRIKLEVFPENRGSAVAVANCCRRARGEYIANLCSDDVWEKDKLEKQVDYLDAHPEIAAVFTKVTIIDEDSQVDLNTDKFYHKVFEVENRSKEQWLRRFFLEGNCLCIPSVMIRRIIYESLNYQDLRMASVSDLDLWVRLSLKHNLHILDERLTRYRLRANNANAGSERIENTIRAYFESKQILNNYRQITQVEHLLAIFPECTNYGSPMTETIPYFLARIAMDCPAGFNQLWGLETLYSYMEFPANVDRLKLLFDFSYKDLHRLAQTVDPYRLRERERLEKMSNAIRRKVTWPLRFVRKQIQALCLKRGQEG